MASITVTTTAEQDAALVEATTRANQQSGESITPQEFLLRQIRHWLQFHVDRRRERLQAERMLKYDALSPADKLLVDNILNRSGGALR
jgi:hypothetical protein